MAKTMTYGSMTLVTKPKAGAKVIASGRLARQTQSVGRLLAVPRELDEAIGAVQIGGPRNALFVALLALGLEALREKDAEIDVTFES